MLVVKLLQDASLETFKKNIKFISPIRVGFPNFGSKEVSLMNEKNRLWFQIRKNSNTQMKLATCLHYF